MACLWSRCQLATAHFLSVRPPKAASDNDNLKENVSCIAETLLCLEDLLQFTKHGLKEHMFACSHSYETSHQ